jgi:hypothetical protein
VELPAEHEATVDGMVRAALETGERPSLDDADAEADADAGAEWGSGWGAGGEGDEDGTSGARAQADADLRAARAAPSAVPSRMSWLDRIEMSVDPSDLALVAAVGEMRKLDRVLRSKTHKLHRFRRKAQLESQGLSELEVETAMAIAAAKARPITPDLPLLQPPADLAAPHPAADEAVRAQGETPGMERRVQGGQWAQAPAAEAEARGDEEQPADLGAAHAEGRAEAAPSLPAEGQAAERRAAHESPPNTAGSLLLGPFLTSTGIVNSRPASGAVQPGQGQLEPQRQAAHLSALARPAQHPPASPSAGPLDGLTAAGMLADAQRELEREGEQAHDMLFARLGIPRLEDRAESDVSEPFSELASRIDPRIVLLTAAERTRLQQLEAMSEAELFLPVMSEQARSRYEALTREIEARFVRPASAAQTGALARLSTVPAAERALHALESACPVSRTTEPLRKAVEEDNVVTKQGHVDYARVLRMEREDRSKLAAIDEQLARLYQRPQSARPPNSDRSAATSRAADNLGAGEAEKLAAILAAVKELAQAELAASAASGLQPHSGATAKRASLGYDYLNLDDEGADGDEQERVGADGRIASGREQAAAG